MACCTSTWCRRLCSTRNNLDDGSAQIPVEELEALTGAVDASTKVQISVGPGMTGRDASVDSQVGEQKAKLLLRDGAASDRGDVESAGATRHADAHARRVNVKWSIGDWEFFEDNELLHFYHPPSGARGVLPQAAAEAREEVPLDFPFESFGASWEPERLPPRQDFLLPNTGFSPLAAGSMRSWGARRAGHCWSIKADVTIKGPKEGANTDVAVRKGVMAARNGVWGEVLDDPEKSWEGNLTVTLRWHESRQKERWVDVVKLGPVVTAMSDLVLEGTGGATITNAVIDAMIASAGGDDFAFGNKQNTQDTEMGLVLVAGGERFTVGLDMPDRTLQDYALQLCSDGLIKFTDERGSVHMAPLFPGMEPLRAVSGGWVIGLASTDPPGVGVENFLKILRDHEQRFSLPAQPTESWRSDSKLSDSEWRAKMAKEFAHGPWASDSTRGQLAAFCQAATQGDDSDATAENMFLQKLPSVTSAFVRAGQDGLMRRLESSLGSNRATLELEPAYDKTAEVGQTFLVLTHLQSEAEVALWADGVGGLSVRFRTKDDGEQAFVHEYSGQIRTSNGMPNRGAFHVLRNSCGDKSRTWQRHVERGVMRRQDSRARGDAPPGQFGAFSTTSSARSEAR